MYLMKQIMIVRHQDRTPITDHLNVIKGIFNQLSTMGIKFEEEV